MTGSVSFLQDGLAGFGLDVLTGVGNPDGVVWSNSGGILVDFTNDKIYQNSTVSNLGAGSSWVVIK